jgi:hypothetical protein
MEEEREKEVGGRDDQKLKLERERGKGGRERLGARGGRRGEKE